MDEKRILSLIREFNRNVNQDYLSEHLGVADKFILSQCVREEGEYFEKAGEARNVRSTNFIKGVMLRMRDYGYKPNSEFLGVNYID